MAVNTTFRSMFITKIFQTNVLTFTRRRFNDGIYSTVKLNDTYVAARARFARGRRASVTGVRMAADCSCSEDCEVNNNCSFREWKGAEYETCVETAVLETYSLTPAYYMVTTCRTGSDNTTKDGEHIDCAEFNESSPWALVCRLSVMAHLFCNGPRAIEDQASVFPRWPGMRLDAGVHWEFRGTTNNVEFLKDKVRVARRAYMKNVDSWKEEAVVSLGYIEGKLFRSLQSVGDDKRTPDLSKAVGMNGVKVSRIIVADKRRENLKIYACQALNQQTWEDVEEHFFKSEEMLRYTGEISSPEGKGRYVTFVNKLSLNSDNCVIISIIVNGIERTFDNEILGKKIKEIKTLVEKEILNEE
ncbi:hypothetical protein MAR_006722 [Mya arenaria]|uniref:Uncharacterized protein n=1 Tax=Mya arenaria TaxID=6604 RepID=A0ABY7DCD6_MYAAR|nr:hypothetical protein MAR_006722 [Mya arenaria]